MDVSRRDALGMLGIVPLATALGTTPDVIERAIQGAQQAQQQQTPYKPKFFSAHEWRTLRVLVDLIIPRDERSGSATDAAVPEFMDFIMIDRPSMQGQMRGGLRWLDNESFDRYGKRYVEATTPQRTAILDDIAWPRKARPEMSQGVAFFNYIRDLTAGGFFSSRMGVQDIGYQGNRMLAQWDGCPKEAMDRLGVNPEMMAGRIPFQR